ncbi:hypothetical protein SPRG_02126 [Saprolegnia parasitica CBS 223.65]|uniref:FAD-binding FR-type domain-containing protein n=1 Tax=Saprolegnia parasitica (strain CBS 223.65) TaxID=695850 RepID=A0A067D2R5_SAPPC|nr:hypothetical protein SPRG_02126 [Saprolegnia parasitica CBS 223.65]KDO33317.1 hypothetical protein SPRG_02126 [Saprolegnia parasitica CBS 223.65]|eukprot:XP_012196067.1 hypothetical protein SPRG_02126 [Saprolegnia parasitica CBS 223.65]
MSTAAKVHAKTFKVEPDVARAVAMRRQLARDAKGLQCLRWAAAIVAVVFVLAYVLVYFIFSPIGAVRIYRDTTVRYAAYVHVLSGSVWLLLSTLQLFPAFRTSDLRRHRIIGYAALSAAAIAFVAVWTMMLIAKTSLEGGLGILVAAALFSPLWAHAIYAGVNAITRGQIELHRYYMTRAYVLAAAIMAMRPGLALLHSLSLMQDVPLFDQVPIILESIFAAHIQDDTRVRLGVVSLVVLALAYMLTEAFAKTPAAFASLLHTTFEPCTLVARKLVAPDLALLVLESPTGTVLHRVTPGHHCALRLAGLTRSYTPVPLALVARKAHAPHRMGVLVKRVAQGALSPLLHDVALGSTIDVLTPIPSAFALQPRLFSELVLVAGGSGLSTMLSLLPDAVSDVRCERIYLHIYTTSGTPFQRELKDTMTSAQLHVFYHKGRPTADDFTAVRPDASMVAVCGPVGFMQTVIATLPNVPRLHVHAFGLDDM